MIPSAPLRQGGEDAGLGPAVGGFVLVRRHRGTCAGAASAAGDPDHRQRRPGEPGCGVRQAVRRHRARFDPTRAAAAGGSAAGVLLDPLRAAVDGAARLQPALSLVRWAGRGRRGVGPLGVLQEPRPAAGGRRGGEVLERGARQPASEAASVGRALLGRRHADRGLGQHEELPRQGWLGRAADAGAQRRA